MSKQKKHENPSLYILQRENKLNTNIYKIGMTTKGFIQRYKSEASYRNCKIVEIREVDNAVEAENILKHKLNDNNFKRCKDKDDNYEGKEDYIIDDYDKFISIFNSVCDEFKPKLNLSEIDLTKSLKKADIDDEINNQIDLEFNSLIQKRKQLIEFLGADIRNDILTAWQDRFDEIFIPIEIIKGNGYHKNKTLKIYLLDHKLLHKLMNNIKKITQTDFLTTISKLVDFDFNKYSGKIKYTKFQNNAKTTIETSGRMMLINFENIKLFIKTNYLFEWQHIDYDQLDIDILEQIQKYDNYDYREIVSQMIENNEQIAIHMLYKNKFNLVIDNNCNVPKINFKLKTITVNYALLDHYQNFDILFINNPTLEYSIIKKYNILSKNNIDDLFMYHNFLDTILRCVINDFENENSDNINYILKFLYNNIYKQSSSKVYTSVFKQSNIQRFENKYKFFKNVSPEIKEKLYQLLTEYASIK